MQQDQKNNSPYTTVIAWHFSCCGETYAVVERGLCHDGTPYVIIEETRKNAPEDCHQQGAAICRDGMWEWESENFSEYDGTDSDILEFLQRHGLPKDK